VEVKLEANSELYARKSGGDCDDKLDYRDFWSNSEYYSSELDDELPEKAPDAGRIAIDGLAHLQQLTSQLLDDPEVKRLSKNPQYSTLISGARSFAEALLAAPVKDENRPLTDEEAAFADEIGKVLPHWPEGGMRGKMRAAEFLLLEWGGNASEKAGVLLNPLFRLATIKRIDLRLYQAYNAGLRPKRLALHPEDDLEFPGQGTKPQQSRVARTADSQPRARPVKYVPMSELSPDAQEGVRQYEAERKARWRAEKRKSAAPK